MRVTKEQEKVLIIGGGAAGLLAAKELCKDYAVTLLEARSAMGGRMLAGGAEFVHGRLPLTLELLASAGLSYTAVTGRFFEADAGNWHIAEGMIEGWDGLLAQMGALTTDTTMSAFLAAYYPGPVHSAFREEVKSYVQGFDLADPDTVSVQALYREWSHEDDSNFRIDGGYAVLIDFLVKSCSDNGCRLLTNQVVTEIAWSAGAVKVFTSSGGQFEASRLIITVPISCLQAGGIRFSPALPQYEAAARQIGWGSVIKVVLTFKEAFWQRQQEAIGFIFSEETIPTWWTQAPDQRPVLTGWLGGPPAKPYSEWTEDALLQTALACLSHIFAMDVAALTALLESGSVFNWENDPFARGAYSYDLPGSPAARQLLNTPVANTIYFAGEALYDGSSPGTVEAAFTSGKMTAAQLKQPV